jgi:hypothetical protein
MNMLTLCSGRMSERPALKRVREREPLADIIFDLAKKKRKRKINS